MHECSVSKMSGTVSRASFVTVGRINKRRALRASSTWKIGLCCSGSAPHGTQFLPVEKGGGSKFTFQILFVLPSQFRNRVPEFEKKK